jgi:hypothetical protein
MENLRIGKYYGNEQDKDVYQIKELLDQDYADITCVATWFLMEKETENDFLYCRDRVIEFITLNGFEALSDNDKILAVKHFCLPKEVRNLISTEKEQELYWEEFCKSSEVCRHNRWEKAKAFASYRLSIFDSNDLGVSTMGLNEKFVKYSITSFTADGISGLQDWVLGENEYLNSGLPNKTYFTEELAQGILNIINPDINQLK